MSDFQKPSLATVRDALCAIDPDSLGYDGWLVIGMALHDWDLSDGFTLFDEWSQRGSKYKPGVTRSKWKGFRQGGGRGIGSVFDEAKSNGWHGQITPPSSAELEARERRQEATRKRAEVSKRKEQNNIARAEKKAALVWEQSSAASADHPYLQRKGLRAPANLHEIDASKLANLLGYSPKADGNLLTGRTLVARLERLDGGLASLEFIDEAGRKSSIAHAKKSLAYWLARPVPDTKPDTSAPILIAEGIATAQTVALATDRHVLASLGFANQVALTKALAERFPERPIVVLADINPDTGRPDPKLLRVCGALEIAVAMPSFPAGPSKTQKDFNDMGLDRTDEITPIIAEAETQAATLRDARNDKSRQVSLPAPALADGPHAAASVDALDLSASELEISATGSLQRGLPPEQSLGFFPSQDDSEQLTGCAPPSESDAGIANLFAERFGAVFRYEHEAGCWYWWNGRFWKRDAQADAKRAMSRICSELASGNKPAREAKQLCSLRTTQNALALATNHPALAVASGQFDANDHLLNALDCVVDLRTGERLKHDPAYLMTKMTGTSALDSSADCSGFLRFLDEITEGNGELQKYLQRVCGYGLTGSTVEQTLFVIYGPGGNGKSVLLDVMKQILGPYSTNVPPEVLTSRDDAKVAPALAGLEGCRLATASETNSCDHFSEARIKQLSGGDTMQARQYYRSYYSFRPKCKLVIVGNHALQLSADAGEAMRRRIQQINLTATIPDAKRDKNLTQKLMAEAAGILNWAIEGCLDWQRLGGLCPPQSVIDDTKEYFEDEDLIVRWLKENTERNRRGSTTTQLYESFSAFQRKIDPQKKVSLTDFGRKLNEKGFPKRKSNGREIRDLTLKTPQSELL